jgi:hypothetical protein
MSATNLNGHKTWPVLLFFVIPLVTLFLWRAPDSYASSGKQQRFSSPDEAVDSLVVAVRANDVKGMLAVLGQEGKELVSSGDEVADRAGREGFLKSFEEMHRVERKSAETSLLHTGKDDWILPIPIVKKNGKWLFDTGRGKQEILDRRIGRNELHVIDTMQAYVDAQHEYATKDCSDCGRVVFAQRLISTPGKRDGLYWEAKEGEKESPFGPLVAQAAREGYANADLSPFHGYYFRILKGQGRHAEGGAYDYVVNGKMLLGFALISYPAEYGNSGIMTFIVNQKGDIYQKNLGKKTTQRVEAIKAFDPGKGWKKVEVKVNQK